LPHHSRLSFERLRQERFEGREPLARLANTTSPSTEAYRSQESVGGDLVLTVKEMFSQKRQQFNESDSGILNWHPFESYTSFQGTALWMDLEHEILVYANTEHYASSCCWGYIFTLEISCLYFKKKGFIQKFGG
jgi:hypothetical protein